MRLAKTRVNKARAGGTELRRALLLAPWLLAAPGYAGQPGAAVTAAPPPYRLEVAVKSRPGAPAVLAGKLKLRPLAKQAEALEVLLPESRKLSLPLPAAGPWELSLTGAGFWAATETLYFQPQAAEQRRILEAWPSGRVGGRVRSSNPAMKLPGEIELQISSAGSLSQKGAMRRSFVSCPVQRTGEFSCDLPATPLDLVFRAAGAAPHYRWEVPVPAGRELALGELKLEAGASIAGWVEVEDGAPEPGVTAVTLSPVFFGQDHQRGANKLAAVATTAAVAPSGFFQLKGLAPGSYALEASQPGYVSTAASGLEVWPGAETALAAPLVLRRPITVELLLVPPTDWLGKPWQARVLRVSELSGQPHPKPIFEGAVAQSGLIRIEGQSPGRLVLGVSDSVGNQLLSRRGLAFGGAEPTHLRIDLEVIQVRGEVRLGNEPLEARVWLGGKHGAERALVEADSEGRFEGVLPRLGRWLYELESSHPPISSYGWVEVQAQDDEEAWLTIVVPQTRLTGRVVDERDQPVEGVNVELASGELGRRVSSDARGRFEFRGVAPGEVSVWAEHRFSSQRVASAGPWLGSLEEGGELGPIELRLRDTQTVSGRVESARGPVAGASVSLYPSAPAGGFGGEAVAGPGGEWVLKVAAAAERLLAVVLPPGGALKAFELPRQEGAVVFHVPLAGGTLEVETHPPASAAEAGRNLLVFQNGLYLPGFQLRRWALGHGIFWPEVPTPRGESVMLEIPVLAAGEYVVCLAPALPVGAPPTVSWARQLGRCDSGFLSEGASLRLSPRGPD